MKDFITIRESRKHRNAKEYYGFGEWHTKQEWALLLGVSVHVLYYSLNSGITVEKFAKEKGIKYPKE